MNHTDTFKIPKPKKEERRGIVTIKAAQASIDRALQVAAEIYGFAITADDPRFSIASTSRSAEEAVVVYGMSGRKLDAAALAYELNN